MATAAVILLVAEQQGKLLSLFLRDAGLSILPTALPSRHRF
jgi:hypothetical protein